MEDNRRGFENSDNQQVPGRNGVGNNANCSCAGQSNANNEPRNIGNNQNMTNDRCGNRPNTVCRCRPMNARPNEVVQENDRPRICRCGRQDNYTRQMEQNENDNAEDDEHDDNGATRNSKICYCNKCRKRREMAQNQIDDVDNTEIDEDEVPDDNDVRECTGKCGKCGKPKNICGCNELKKNLLAGGYKAIIVICDELTETAIDKAASSKIICSKCKREEEDPPKNETIDETPKTDEENMDDKSNAVADTSNTEAPPEEPLAVQQNTETPKNAVADTSNTEATPEEPLAVQQNTETPKTTLALDEKK